MNHDDKDYTGFAIRLFVAAVAVLFVLAAAMSVSAAADEAPAYDPKAHTHYNPENDTVTMPARLYEGMVEMLEAQRRALREKPVEDAIKRRAMEIARTMGCS